MGQVLMKTSKKKREINFEIKEQYFMQYGSILFEKQIALRQGQDIGSGQLKIFSAEDVAKATNWYDPNLIVGHVLCTIYKGTLDDHTVASKAPVGLKPSPRLIDNILTAASTGMVMNHSHLVKLYGCCLETCVSILAYEFLTNGSLFHHLHSGISLSMSLKWGDRLGIATDISYALSYMHNALPKPIVHRDVKSLNVLLDDSFHAKLSNLGHSVSNTPGETQSWPVKHNPGYTDPEYIESQEVTKKCDVYSFGILMLELLTGMQPIRMAKDGVDLVDVFV